MIQDADRILRETTSLIFFPDAEEMKSLLELIERTTIKFMSIEASTHDPLLFEEQCKRDICHAIGLDQDSNWGRLFDELVDIRNGREGFIFRAAAPNGLELSEASTLIRILVQAGLVWKADGKAFITIIELELR